MRARGWGVALSFACFAAPVVAGARDNSPVPQAIICACMCVEKTSKVGGIVYKFAAPNGDPTQCDKLEGVPCNPSDADGNPKEGYQLKDCEAGTGQPTRGGSGGPGSAPEKAAPTVKPPAPRPGYIWVDDHWERERAR